MIGQTAIAIALIGFNVLGRSVTPTFLSRYRLYLQLFPHCPKMNKKSMRGVKKNLKVLKGYKNEFIYMTIHVVSRLIA